MVDTRAVLFKRKMTEERENVKWESDIALVRKYAEVFLCPNVVPNFSQLKVAIMSFR